MDRRAVLAWAGGLAAAMGGTYYAGLSFGGPKAAPKGYGRDPDMLHPTVPWPRTLTERQRTQVTRLVDFILPREGSVPSASDVGVHELIDEWVSAPYPDQQADRTLFLDGLDRMDVMARHLGARDFVGADRMTQERILEAVGDPKSTAATAPFYKRFRRIVMGGYYTTEAGMADLGYVGNQPLKSYPAPTPEMVAQMERVFLQLGLVDRTSEGPQA